MIYEEAHQVLIMMMMMMIMIHVEDGIFLYSLPQVKWS